MLAGLDHDLLPEILIPIPGTYYCVCTRAQIQITEIKPTKLANPVHRHLGETIGHQGDFNRRLRQGNQLIQFFYLDRKLETSWFNPLGLLEEQLGVGKGAFGFQSGRLLKLEIDSLCEPDLFQRTLPALDGKLYLGINFEYSRIVLQGLGPVL